MKKYVLKVADKVYNVTVEVNDDIADVIVNGNKYNVLIENIIDENETKPIVRKKTIVVPTNAPVVVSNISAEDEVITSPLPGNVLEIDVIPNTHVKKGDVLLIIEAMKMENNILAPHDGVVSKIHVKTGDIVNLGDALISLEKVKIIN
jgi:biotin carboxyl carrier protein